MSAPACCPRTGFPAPNAAPGDGVLLPTPRKTGSSRSRSPADPCTGSWPLKDGQPPCLDWKNGRFWPEYRPGQTGYNKASAQRRSPDPPEPGSVSAPRCPLPCRWPEDRQGPAFRRQYGAFCSGNRKCGFHFSAESQLRETGSQRNRIPRIPAGHVPGIMSARFQRHRRPWSGAPFPKDRSSPFGDEFFCQNRAGPVAHLAGWS